MNKIINKSICSFLFFLLLVTGNNPLKAQATNNDTKAPQQSVAGHVWCNHTGISGVVVTDGTNFTVTNGKGFYTLPPNPASTHVYISSPAGYTVPVENSVAMFWVKLNREANTKNNVDFRLTKLADKETNHYFIAVGDPQVSNRADLEKLKPILANIKAKIAGLPSKNVPLLVAGDIVFDTPQMHTMSKQYFSKVEQPVYYCIGNHDHVYSKKDSATLDNDLTADSVYIRHYGPTHYSFNRGEVHYVVLDDIRYKGGPKPEYTTEFAQEQLDWLKKDLSYVPKEKALVLLFHAPSKTRFKARIGNNTELYKLLQGYANVQTICGHTHYNSVVADDGSGITEHILGTACGSFWESPVGLDGCPLGYKVFEVNGTKFKWRYIDYTDKQKLFTVYKPGERSPALPPAEELLVNVWDWDPAWEVAYSEDGEKTFKPMTRIKSTYDPTAYEFIGLKGERKVPSRSWLGSSATDHIFFCVPSAATTEMVIKVTTRFGEVSTRHVDLRK
ncbi:calcineurin-like phosphoesterase family protein [uncultured Bacteroides sp.]|uniref:calcineurin-like phosphoesterase family protein n=1 Tax=uncultured Bacteroides sp. TaxID=162156 RepID=UPI002AA8AE0C|nr:calcineurin-like phosphoesterase family protein [uncultured Bacteroides sp.]